MQEEEKVMNTAGEMVAKDADKIESPYIAPEVPNLEKLRDDKCLPVAQAMLEDMVELLIPADPANGVEWKPIVMKMLERSLEADLNIQTEVSYVPQLILGALSGLNITTQGCDIAPVDEVRYAAIGKKILSMVAGAKVRMVNVKPEDTEVDFASVKEQLNKLFAEEKLNRLEVKFILDNIFESFKAATTIFTHSLDSSVARAEAKAFAVEAMSDVTMKMLDGFLTADVLK